MLVSSEREKEHKQDVFAVVTAVTLKFSCGMTGISKPYFVICELDGKYMTNCIRKGRGTS